MSTANQAVAKARANASAKDKDTTTVEVAAPSRREFLNYIWGASIALLVGQTLAGVIWYAFPRFKEGEFGGIFQVNPDEVPSVGSAPTSIPSGRFWMSNVEGGLLALYGVCTHLGCLPKWVSTNHRFECPCHGSKFEANGDYIEGPAPRGLDRFATTLTFDDGSSASTPSDGGPIPIPEGKTVVGIAVNTGSKVTGPS
ncbi:hypothetical protein MASR2M15_19030 [Anaerolineales bacterium]